MPKALVFVGKFKIDKMNKTLKTKVGIILIAILLVMVTAIRSEAKCTLQVDPNNVGWCRSVVENGEITDWVCDKNADPGNNIPKNCEVLKETIAGED